MFEGAQGAGVVLCENSCPVCPIAELAGVERQRTQEFANNAAGNLGPDAPLGEFRNATGTEAQRLGHDYDVHEAQVAADALTTIAQGHCANYTQAQF